MSRIEYSVDSSSEGLIRLSGRLITSSGESHEVQYEFTLPEGRECRPTVRPFLLSFLLPAMKLGDPLQLPERVDSTTLRNLTEWQQAYASVSPELSVIEIKNGTEARPVSQERMGVLSAFSGGVDSCFSAIFPGEGTIPDAGVTAGLMVQGFDIDLAQDEVFEKAWAGSQELLRSVGKDAYRMKTNSREMNNALGIHWSTHSHGILLAAALACYESIFERVVIPSSYAYRDMKFPWGSGPATDYLFSSEDTFYWHDGAAYNKLDKVHFLAQNETV